MNIPRRYENAKWEEVPEPIKKAFEKIMSGGKGIYLYGGVGTGKTHICWAIKKHYDQPDKYRYLMLRNVVDIMKEIRDDFDRSASEKHYVESDLTDQRERRILILDDIGAEKATEFVAETLYRIINHRYINMLPTIFTSNYNIQELAERIGERSASRIVEMCEIIQLTGGDRRIKK